jgi:DNA-binding beta-propeller fold protein YncE
MKRWSFARLSSLVACGLLATLSALSSSQSPAINPTATPTPKLTSRFTLFESGQVRPLARSADGSRLFAVNTPASTLEVFAIESRNLRKTASIPVGLEPVSVAVHGNEAWVVNHLSDSVSIVDVRAGKMRVVRTLLVGDEPRDIVFGGPQFNLAFVTTAHRGQNSPIDPQFTTPGIGRADVWVFDADAQVSGVQADTLGGKPLTILSLFSDTPRALAVSPDGTRVYAAGFLTGNRTTIIPAEIVAANGGLPPPLKSLAGVAQPSTGLIVKFNGQHWTDELGRSWDTFVHLSLPDKDVFAIDATAMPPKQAAGQAGYFTGVGTVLFNMAINPQNGHIYVSNTDAINDVRFEVDRSVFPGSSVQGHLHESRISVLNPANGTVLSRHLNKHIDYSACCQPIPNSENERSLAFPMGMQVSGDGKKLYVAAFGSSKIGVFSTQALEDNSFVPSAANQIHLSEGGPSGLLLDDAHGILYVLTRFNNSVAVVDTRTQTEIGAYALVNPEPEDIVQGRKLFYDASHVSSHGDSACASCHVFGDFDGLAWDLGTPSAATLNNPGPFSITPAMQGSNENTNYFALKGPMTTLSMRGMSNHGPMHWRGDRTGGNDAPSAQPDSGTFDEQAAFKKFNPAFVDLLGRSSELTDAEMQSLTNFMLQVSYPPNPIRNLDNSLTPEQKAGSDFFFNQISDTLVTCNGCHVLNPSANAEFGVPFPGFFGTDGRSAFDVEPQVFKTPHFRNQYQKVGMFGVPPLSNRLPDNPDGTNNFTGDQVRGFGFSHDGSDDTVFRFLTFTPFRHVPASGNNAGNPGFADGQPGTQQRREMESFLLAFPSNLAPIVGQQVTVTTINQTAASSRIDLLIDRAQAGECDLVVSRRSGRNGYLYAGSGMFFTNQKLSAKVSDTLLRRKIANDGVETTYTCTPPGSGLQMAFGRGGINDDQDDVEAAHAQ